MEKARKRQGKKQNKETKEGKTMEGISKKRKKGRKKKKKRRSGRTRGTAGQRRRTDREARERFRYIQSGPTRLSGKTTVATRHPSDCDSYPTFSTPPPSRRPARGPNPPLPTPPTSPPTPPQAHLTAAPPSRRTSTGIKAQRLLAHEGCRRRYHYYNSDTLS